VKNVVCVGKNKRIIMRIIKLLTLFVFVSLAICACTGSVYELEPVGIGKDPSELKLSPCACIKLENGTKLSVSDFS
jgi:hypothetical protein